MRLRVDRGTKIARGDQNWGTPLFTPGAGGVCAVVPESVFVSVIVGTMSRAIGDVGPAFHLHKRVGVAVGCFAEQECQQEPRVGRCRIADQLLVVNTGTIPASWRTAGQAGGVVRVLRVTGLLQATPANALYAFVMD